MNSLFATNNFFFQCSHWEKEVRPPGFRVGGWLRGLAGGRVNGNLLVWEEACLLEGCRGEKCLYARGVDPGESGGIYFFTFYQRRTKPNLRPGQIIKLRPYNFKDFEFFKKFSCVHSKFVPCNRLATHIIVYMGSKPVARYEFSL